MKFSISVLILAFLFFFSRNLWAGPQVLVAVIDTGIDSQHPALNSHIWQNPGETGLDINGQSKSTNAIDDDQNGFIDDVQGWNFAQNTNDITDSHGHGTHIAGLILGVNKTQPPTSDAQLMILKYYDPQQSGEKNLKNLVQAIRYAIQMKVQIINYSGGGFVPDDQERKAITEAAKAGILFVAAAGNEGRNSDQTPFYPADYDLPNILSVANLKDHGLADSSNFGFKSVAMAASGYKALSTLPNNQWGQMTGTSQATARVTNAAVSLISQRPDLRNPPDLIAHLRGSSHFESALAGRVASAGRLDLPRLLALQDRARSFSGYRIRTFDPSLGMQPDVARLK